MVFTLVVLVIIAAVSVSLLQGPQEAKQELIKQDNIINEFYEEQNQIQNELVNEIGSDYNSIDKNVTVGNDTDLPVSSSTEDWDFVLL